MEYLEPINERPDCKDLAYLDAKHALDNAFEAGHDAWLAEITQNTLAAL